MNGKSGYCCILPSSHTAMVFKMLLLAEMLPNTCIIDWRIYCPQGSVGGNIVKQITYCTVNLDLLQRIHCIVIWVESGHPVHYTVVYNFNRLCISVESQNDAIAKLNSGECDVKSFPSYLGLIEVYFKIKFLLL